MFENFVREAIESVKKEHVRRFSAKCRRYMMAYNKAYNNNEDPITYQMIECFVKMAKFIKTLSIRK